MFPHYLEKKIESFSYKNNNEYRQLLRTFFSMNPTNPTDTENLDEETLDELLFDNKNVLSIFDDIYEKTIDDILFSELYELAAACFISTDKKLGVTVLFAYDYFISFYPLLLDYFSGSHENLKETNKYYIELKTKLHR